MFKGKWEEKCYWCVGVPMTNARSFVTFVASNQFSRWLWSRFRSWIDFNSANFCLLHLKKVKWNVFKNERTIEKSPISSCSRAKVLFHIIVLHKAHLMTIQCFCLIYKFSRFAMEILSFCHGNLNLNFLVWKFRSYILPNSKVILCLCKDQHNNTDPARLICPELISFTSCPRERTERYFYVNTLV